MTHIFISPAIIFYLSITAFLCSIVALLFHMKKKEGKNIIFPENWASERRNQPKWCLMLEAHASAELSFSHPFCGLSWVWPWPDFDPRSSESPTFFAEGRIQQCTCPDFIGVYVWYAYIGNTQWSKSYILYTHLHGCVYTCVCIKDSSWDFLGGLLANTALPVQGAWVRSLVRELDPICRN